MAIKVRVIIKIRIIKMEESLVGMGKARGIPKTKRERGE